MARLLNLCCGKDKTLPIETVFRLSSTLPTPPQGEGFASGSIDLGGLQVCQVTSFTKVWSTREGGPGNLGSSFFEPSQVPEGFSVLGYYAQPNNKPLFGWVLAGKDLTGDPFRGALKMPVDFTLVWSSESLKIKQDGIGYIWLPNPPEGYKALGYVVTNSPTKPPLDKIRCVHSTFTDLCQRHNWIWGLRKKRNTVEFNVYSLRPTIRGTKALGISTGAFLVENCGDFTSLACLKNTNPNYLSSMPNLDQVHNLIQAYSPCIYFHPSEKYFPSSVSWFFENGALLYQEGEGLEPVPVDPTGSNLPQGGSDDGAFWLDLPRHGKSKKRGKKGNLEEAEVYLHIKPMLGATFTDIAIWARIFGLVDVSLGKIGEHVGDWEHLTLRVSNFNGELRSAYLSQHSKGTWVEASELEFQDGSARPVIYASVNGHALYPRPGSALQGKGGIGVTNDTARSKKLMDTGARFQVVAADYLGPAIVEPPWLNYLGEWGPKLAILLLGKEGPLGPKMKRNWSGDEEEFEKD
ncbi:hypothetical protein NMG60_11023284 [Bertholletia excelsa]